MSSSIIGQLKARGKEALAELYTLYRKEFLAWAIRQFNCSADEAKDAYQQAILIFYDNFTAGKLDQLQSTEKTYLFAIGKNKLHENLRRVARYDKMTGLDWPDEMLEESQPSRPAGQIMDSLKLLGEPCQSLLEQFYFHCSNMDVIMEKFGYKNKDTAKSQKYKCLERLRKIFKGQQPKSGL
jgi:RNA polymerase sigma factor (sigma-70 family)